MTFVKSFASVGKLYYISLNHKIPLNATIESECSSSYIAIATYMYIFLIPLNATIESEMYIHLVISVAICNYT